MLSFPATPSPPLPLPQAGSKYQWIGINCENTKGKTEIQQGTVIIV